MTAIQEPSVARGVELLERSIGWTRVSLVAASALPADAPTPCEGWDVGDLLAHMVDGFTALVESAAGRVGTRRTPPLPREPALLAGHLLDLGCGVLGGWTSHVPYAVGVGGLALAPDTVLEVAALEVAVHGWDVGRAAGLDRPLPSGLAAALLPVAVRHVHPLDRPARFGAVVDQPRRDPSSLLLAHLGRRA